MSLGKKGRNDKAGRNEMTANDDYLARLARVKANQGQSVIMVGSDESFVHRRREVVPVSKSKEVLFNLGYPAGLASAFLLGMVAVAVGRYARFHLMSGQAELSDPDLEMALSAFVGFCASFALAQMFRLTSMEHKGLQSAGIFLMVAGFHNLAFWAPNAMATAFSADYVLQIQMNGAPNSLRLGGTFIPLTEQTYSTADLILPSDTTDGSHLIAAPVPSAVLAAAPCKDGPRVNRLELNGERRKSVPQNDVNSSGACAQD